ncbi:hypothetical protein FD754_021016 [Muntiacus muntjak]|uniref:Small integral membrane protein 13 n=1 Tax=Muntiacus muntjak TaxID=9888 RepID=A0A5N3V6C8_MUNMU|nr:hypothetical protein FD754_021016 [Muntiacus muntjak]
MWHNVGLTLLVFVATLLIVLLLIVCGFFGNWWGDTGSQEGDCEPSGSETEEDASPSPHRIRSARQRRAPADEGH